MISLFYNFGINFRVIDTLIKRRFLQIFNTPSNESEDNATNLNLSFKSSTQLQNKDSITKHQRAQHTPYQKQSSITEECFNCKKGNSQKRNNFQNNIHTSTHHHKCSTKLPTLSVSSRDFPIILQSTSTVAPHLPSVLNTTSCYNTTDCSWAKVTRTEEIQLRNAAWYQPGLSR